MNVKADLAKVERALNSGDADVWRAWDRISAYVTGTVQVGWVRSNGAGEVIFQHDGAERDMEAAGWRKVYLIKHDEP